MLARTHSECKRIAASTKCGDSVPNTCFFPPRLVKIGCALAICTWNDGCSSLHDLVQRLELQPTLSSLYVLQAQNLERLSRSVYKESSSAKLLKKSCRRKRKGNEDNNEAQEGGKMYAAGEFGEWTECNHLSSMQKSAECKLPLQIGVTWTRLLCTYMACELYKSVSVDILL